MSAYGFSDEQLEALRKAIKERLDRMPLHPHQRLGYPPIAKGKDVVVDSLTTEQTAEHFKKKTVN